MSGRGVSRLPLLLAELADDGAYTAAYLAEQLSVHGWSMPDTDKAIGNAVQAGYVERAGTTVTGQATYSISAFGRVKLGKLMPRHAAAMPVADSTPARSEAAQAPGNVQRGATAAQLQEDMDTQVVRDVDMAQVHRTHRASVARQAASKVAAFRCALYSDGELLLESNGLQMTLPQEHTQRLMHYLEHMASTGAAA